MKKQPKLPNILYEETLPGEPINPIPYIDVAKDEESPKVLFISIYKETGEWELADEDGAQQPIVEAQIHKFVDMEFLKEKLSPKLNDQVRVALGMQPLKIAQKKGQKILNKVFKGAEENLEQLKNDPETRAKRAFGLGENERLQAEKLKKQIKEMKEKEEN